VANWVYRRPFDYRVFRTWIMPSPQLTIDVSDTVTLGEAVLGTVTGVGILTPIASESVTVAEVVVAFPNPLPMSVTDAVTLAEAVALIFGGILDIVVSDTVTVAEDIDLKLRLDVTLAGGRLLTMKVGG